MTTVAEAIACELRATGVRHFFLVTGADNSLWIALRDQNIAQILARSEAAAVYMADGYARVTGRPTPVYGQFGPGAANVAGALPEALWSSSPIVAMPTAVRRAHRHAGEYQELRQRELFAPVTTWQAEVQIPDQAPALLRAAAVQAAASPGPVYVGIPTDILEEALPPYEPPAADSVDLRIPWQRPRAPRGVVADILATLDAADRPVLLAGNGVHLSGAYEPLAAAATALDLPVATSLSGKGSFDESNDLSIGVVGRYSRQYANPIIRDADFILAVGTSLGSLVTDNERLLANRPRIVQVDANAGALRTDAPSILPVQADAADVLEELADLSARRSDHQRRPAWLERVRSARRRWRARAVEIAAAGIERAGPMRPEAVLTVIDELAPREARFVADTGYAAAWTGSFIEIKQAGRRFLRADGSLGWAFPAALGVQLAAPGDLVVAIIGDGGFGYHIGEIETALRLELPVVVVILNNHGLAFEAHVQSILYDRVVEEVDRFLDLDYGAVARSFGADGVRVTSVDEFRAAFGRALERERVSVIDAVVDPDAIGPVTRYDAVRTREL